MKAKIRQHGFTLIEVLVSITIILVLAAALTVSLRFASASAHKANHVSNLRQLWATAILYSSDNQGFLPPNKAFGTGTWQHHLVRWHENLSPTETSLNFEKFEKIKPTGFYLLFNSPVNKTRGNMGFGSGGWPTASSTTEVFGRSLASIADPAKSIALLPCYSDSKTLRGGNWQRPGGNVSDVTFDSKGLAACAFVDGSVSPVSRKAISEGRYVYIYPAVDQR